jgi:hypothetical protein
MSDFPLRDKCEEKAERLNIPHFTLLACDNFACDLVEQWLEKAKEAGISPEKYNEAYDLALIMRAWRIENPHLCKNPD